MSHFGTYPPGPGATLLEALRRLSAQSLSNAIDIQARDRR